MSEHKKTISALAWCPHAPSLLATAGADHRVIVWDVVARRSVATLEASTTAPAPCSVAWMDK